MPTGHVLGTFCGHVQPHIPFTFYDELPSGSATSHPSASKKQVLAYVAIPPRTPSPTKAPPMEKWVIVTKKKARAALEVLDEDTLGLDTTDSNDAPIMAKKKQLVIELSSEDDEEDCSSDELCLKPAFPPKVKTMKTTMKWHVISPKKGPPTKRRARSSLDGNNRSTKKRKVAVAASKKHPKGIDLSHLEIDEDLLVDPRLVPRIRGMVRHLVTGHVPG